ncbi:MAG: hypothetical protein L7S64_10725 [Longimicrobiales bacterium]|jgi:hypothetical protein|nr:hypothetical protein [Longimicrobiales bacterium]
MSERAATLLAGRRERIERVLERGLDAPTAGANEPITDETRSYLLSEVQDLYWNEIEWEHITDEESLDVGPLAELTFPGFLAYVRGLLLSEVMPDSLSPANPRPQVVSDTLDFLATRVVKLQDELVGPDDGEGEQLQAEMKMTHRLIDQVLYLYHGLNEADVARVEQAPA